MSSEWCPTKLGGLVDVKHGFAFKGEFFTDQQTAFQLTTPGNFAIGGGFQAGKGKFYSGPVPGDFVLKAGDLLVTMTDLSKAADTLGYAAKLPVTPGVTWLHNQRVGLVTVKPGVAALESFLHYLMRSPDYRHWVVSTATGSTVKHTSPSRICDYDFLLPPLDCQQEVAGVLDALEDRITLLRETNATLEAIAQALFKSWFVDFDPVRAKMEGRAPEGMDEVTAALFPDSLEETELGFMPKGWRASSVYEIAKVIYGAPFASKQFKSEPPGMPLVRIRDLKDERPGVYTEEVHAKGYMLQPGDIAVGMDGEFRSYLWGGESAWLNQRVCVFQPVGWACSVFVRLSIAPLLAQVEASETATTVIHLGKNDIDRFRVLLPCPEVLSKFSELAEPLYSRVIANKQQAQSLSALRDTLLPRLISGQLRLTEAMFELDAA